MKIRSRAPLRIGLAGGGTDLESYYKQFGGMVLNTTIGMYAYCTIIPTDDNTIKIYSYDNQNHIETKSVPELPLDGDNLILHRGVYNRIVRDYNDGKPLSFIMSTANDAPIGSGLGTSSTMVVTIVEAFNRWLGLGLHDYDKARLAYEIEREDLKLVGGKQDQYAAVFGGLNFMEFHKDGGVIVNTLRLEKRIVNELENSLLLYYSGHSRKSAEVQLELTNNIIKRQNANIVSKKDSAVDALANIKAHALLMKDSILTGNMEGFADVLRQGWANKKKTSSIVSNEELDKNIEYAFKNGAEAVKVSGAGGGGFLLLYVNPINRQRLIKAMEELPGKVYPVSLYKYGVESWTID